MGYFLGQSVYYWRRTVFLLRKDIMEKVYQLSQCCIALARDSLVCGLLSQTTFPKGEKEIQRCSSWVRLPGGGSIIEVQYNVLLYAARYPQKLNYLSASSQQVGLTSFAYHQEYHMFNGTPFETMMQSRYVMSWFFLSFYLLEFMLKVSDDGIGRFNVWN